MAYASVAMIAIDRSAAPEALAKVRMLERSPRSGAAEMAHEGVPLVVIQWQLGHYAGDPVKRREGRRVRVG